MASSGQPASDSTGLSAHATEERTAVALFTPDGILVEANQIAFDAVGLTPQNALGKRYDELQSVSHRSDVIEQAGQMLSAALEGRVVRRELPLRLAGDRIAVMDCMASPLRDAHGRTVRIVATGVEITARRNSEASLRRLNRALRMLSACNQLLARVHHEKDLLEGVCQTVVEVGEYPFAWVGRAEEDGCTVRPLASAGADQSYVDQLEVGWVDGPLGDGPTGRAIREQKYQVCHDIAGDPAFAPWREAAIERGYASSIALPVAVESERLALNIYSQRQDAFDNDEVQLLLDLTGDLEHGLRSLRAVAAHERAESRLRLFRQLLDEANDFIYLVDLTTGRIIDANAAMTRHLGYRREELLSMKLSDFSVTASEVSWGERVRFARQTGSFTVEGAHRRKNGESVPVEIGGTYVEHAGAPYLITVTRDISDRKRHEGQIARLARISRMQAAVNAAILRTRDRDELLAEACRLATEVGGYDRAVVSLVEPDGRHARPRYRHGHGEDFPEPELLPIGDGSEPDVCLSGRALRTGEVALCTDLTKSEPPVAMRQKLVSLGYRSIIALPLIVEGHRLGVLTLALRDTNVDWEEELLLLQDMTATLSFALRAQRQADEVHLMALYDPLTGLANRALLCRQLDESIAQPDVPSKHPAVAAFDVHHLSKINDTYGRRFGDLLLQQVAARLKHHTADDRRIGYLGGGTFVLVEPELVSSDETIVSLLESTIFADPFTIEGRMLRVTFRSGVAHFPADGTEGDALVQKAEAALRHAKDTGEQYIHYAIDIQSQVAQRIAVENRLQAALDEQQFELYYQPQIAVASGRIESVEALLRWNDPERGTVEPADFLPVLESSALIVSVGNWVLGRALSDCRRWAEKGLGPVRVAVNVSPLQVRRRNFVPLVLDLLRLNLGGRTGYGLDLEITETAFLQDVEGASRKLQELRDVGVRIALDDFGTGYSSLGLLSKLPVDLLKIDRSFVAGLPGDDASAMLVRSIVQLASAFRLVTVAEGVETPAQMNLLRQMSCHQTQGYLHSRPVTASQLESILRNPAQILSTAL